MGRLLRWTPNSERFTPPGQSLLCELRWMPVSEFLDTVEDEAGEPFADFAHLPDACISEPVPLAHRAELSSAIDALHLRQALLIAAGTLVTDQGTEPAARLVVFGPALRQLKEAGLALSLGDWPNAGALRERMVAVAWH